MFFGDRSACSTGVAVDDGLKETLGLVFVSVLFEREAGMQEESVHVSGIVVGLGALFVLLYGCVVVAGSVGYLTEIKVCRGLFVAPLGEDIEALFGIGVAFFVYEAHPFAVESRRGGFGET